MSVNESLSVIHLLAVRNQGQKKKHAACIVAMHAIKHKCFICYRGAGSIDFTMFEAFKYDRC